MTNAEAVNWLINITADIGKAEHSDLWHYEQALSEIREMLEDAQPETHDKRTETHEWIPCDETVEVPDHEVLACDKYGEEILGYLEYADDLWTCASEDCVMYDPIAWMEKPEPYVERRQDDVR